MLLDHCSSKGRESDLRSRSQSNLPRRATHHRRPIHALLGRLAQLRVLGDLLRALRIHNHDLALLAMRARCAVQEHGLGRRNHDVEGAHVGLAVLERNVPAVDAALHRLAGRVGRRLRHRVVAVAELELHNVADGRDEGVGHEGILGATDDDGDYLVGPAVGTAWEGVRRSEVVMGDRVCTVD
jgi:hypothetical protein